VTLLSERGDDRKWVVGASRHTNKRKDILMVNLKMCNNLTTDQLSTNQAVNNLAPPNTCQTEICTFRTSLPLGDVQSFPSGGREFRAMTFFPFSMPVQMTASPPLSQNSRL